MTTETIQADLKRIWLEPNCEGAGRCWSEDRPEDCNEPGGEAMRPDGGRRPPMTETIQADSYEAAHTPGPWYVVPYGDGDSLVICSDEGGEWRICFMATHGGTPAVWQAIQANARLIARAPDLEAENARLREENTHLRGIM